MSDHPSSLSGAFGRPFPEQIAYFRQKLGNLVPTRVWTDLFAEANDTGFMVAGAMKADLLTDLAAAVQKALAEGRGGEEFRRDFRAIVARNGWTGWTGEGSTRGEAWRVKTILSTNAYTSYSAGRLAQLRAGNFKFWVYRHGGSLEPRPEHLSWNGLALPPDHDFWKKHYPPSDWGCSCYVIGARDEEEVRQVGGNPAKTLPDGWDRINPKTGEPIGIGKGWGYAPGASVAPIVQAMAAKIRNWDYAVAKAFMSELPRERADQISQAYRALPSTADDTRRFAQAINEERAPAGDAPVRTLGLVPADQEAAISGMIGETVNGFDFRLSQDAVRHVLDEHGSDATEAPRGQRAVRTADFAKLPTILSDPDAIEGPDTSNVAETLIHLVKDIDGERYTATMAVNRRYRSLSLKTMFVRARKGK